MLILTDKIRYKHKYSLIGRILVSKFTIKGFCDYLQQDSLNIMKRIKDRKKKEHSQKFILDEISTFS
jgi:hypothetical protein